LKELEQTKHKVSTEMLKEYFRIRDKIGFIKDVKQMNKIMKRKKKLK